MEKKLPEIIKPHLKRSRRFVIGDSIEGWSDAIKVLIKSYMGASALFIGSVIDFSTPSMMLFWFRC